MTLPNYLTDLNPQQYEAVTHSFGPLLIFAGAGSGKTRVLTRRIAHIMLDLDAHPEQILAVTFTNKAAKEMKERVAHLFASPERFYSKGVPSWVSTFHSSSLRILRQHAAALDYRSDFAIYDSADTLSTLKRVYKKLKLDPKVLEPRFVAGRIDRAKNEYQSPDDVRKDKAASSSIAETIAEIYLAYQKELLESNAMDFGDLLSNVVTLFRFNPKILALYQEQFQHILIDEYQDTNRVQYLLVKLLTDKDGSQPKNIAVVGDDDQSIYAFRGATIDNILNFKRDFPDAKVVTLEENYRSTGNILKAASSVIANNSYRQKKTLRTESAAGEPIVCFKAWDEREEAEFITQQVLKLTRSGSTLSDIAIFYRTNAQSRAIEEGLVELGIPYEIFGGHGFYDRKEVKDILAYYRLVLNPDDNEAFLRVVNTPPRGIGSVTLDKLIAEASKAQVSLLRFLHQEPTNALTKKFQSFLKLEAELQLEREKAEKKLTRLVEGERTDETLEAIAEFIRALAERSNYVGHLKAQDSVEAEGRIENIFELTNVARDFIRTLTDTGVAPRLGDFLDRASLASDLDKENDLTPQSSRYRGQISMMTLHLCKGLEFDSVFLVGLEEGILPHSRSINNPSDIEEERRLCYVGMTRARKRLFLTRAVARQTWAKNNFYQGEPSRFVFELPRGVISDPRGGFTEASEWA